MDKDIKIIIKRSIKNNLLLELMELYNIKNSSELAKLTNTSKQQISKIMNLTCRDDYQPAIQLAKYFNLPVEFILTPEMTQCGRKFKGLQNIQEKYLDSIEIISIEETTKTLCISNDIESDIIQKVTREEIENMLNYILSPRHKDVLLLRLGWYEEPKTLEEIAKKYKVTKERIRCIENKAIKKIRESKYISKLRILADKKSIYKGA